MTPKQRAVVLAIVTPLAMTMEGTRQWAYRDSTGLPTICMGSTKGVKMGDFRTIPECKALLTKEMSDVIDTVDRCRPGLPVSVLAAFSDAGYNVGSKIACDPVRSTAARLLAEGKFREACEQLPRWRFAKVGGIQVVLPGLEKRRNAEMALCLQGLDSK